jgi:glycosyltransferase involved in cell wall biosynthesis
MAKRFLIWFWSGGGGGSAFSVNLAHRLRLQFGAGAVTLSLRADDPTLARARDEGLNVLSAEIVSDRRRPLATIAALAQSGSILAEHARDSDLVIVPMNFASAAPLSARLKQPLIYCAHDPEPHPGDYARALQRMTQTVLLRRACRVVALSEYAAGRLRTRGVGAKKLKVVPLTSVFEPQPQSVRAEGPVRLLFAGRMIPYKGVDILADALVRLSLRDDWRLTVSGSGPALDDATARRFAYPQVERVGRDWLSDAELDALIAGCDVLLAPYRSATQSGLVAQALAYGRPCVVTPVGALREQVDGDVAGLVAADVGAAAFAAAMEAVLDRPHELEKKAAAALRLSRAAWEHDHWGWLSEL